MVTLKPKLFVVPLNLAGLEGSVFVTVAVACLHGHFIFNVGAVQHVWLYRTDSA